ncbi:exopolysaccharide biosynthesis protein [Roseovarius spongiae]|uniref:exopolysaccharide biosynthesis protein n=1 Tax=Roseovarius spongiae TaxID=2320272 RepID=UPI001FE6021B|nr:exopolysaccharide biosynthesis protein [Roseovarius spongiae]
MPRLLKRLETMARGEESVALERLTREIGAQGHAPLLMVVAALMILPIGMIPGIGGALGAVVALIGLQMLLGRTGVWMPAFLGRRRIPAARVRSLCERMRPAAEWLRRHLHPRWESLSGGALSLSVIAAILIVLGGSLLVLGVIPVATPLVGVPVAFFAFGLLGRDGVVVAAGYVLIVVVLVGLWFLRGTTG